jgi:CheY-like chemotaxis protein
VAHDGPAAILAADELAPHVALLDVGLPVMDGYELATRLRDARRGEPLRLVAITGYGQSADRERAAQAGFDAHLVKPVDFDRIAQLLDGWRGEDDGM